MTDERAPTAPEAAQRIESTESVLESNDQMSVALCDAGRPWIGKVFFVEDEPQLGKLDVCCAIVSTERNLGVFTGDVAVGFLAGGEEPDRWVQGTGTASIVADEADAGAIAKRLRDRSPAAALFLDLFDTRAVRIHVQRMRLVDLDGEPPITEFTFS